MGQYLKRDEQIRMISDIASTMEESAKKSRLSVDISEVSVVSHSRVCFATAPIAEQDQHELTKLILTERPVMYWYLSGGFVCGGKPVPEGFYVVMTQPDRRQISLVDAEGNIVGEGDLNISVDTGQPDVSPAVKGKCSIGISDFDIGATGAKICGKVTCSAGRASVTMSGCIEVSWI